MKELSILDFFPEATPADTPLDTFSPYSKDEFGIERAFGDGLREDLLQWYNGKVFTPRKPPEQGY